MAAHLEYLGGGSVEFRVVRRRGTYLSKMGSTRDGQCYLSAEEALFLLENGLARVTTADGTTITVSHLHRILTNEGAVSLHQYAAYAQMVKAGYALRRRQSSGDEANQCSSIDCLAYDVFSGLPSSTASPEYVLLTLRGDLSIISDKCLAALRQEAERCELPILVTRGCDPSNVKITKYIIDTEESGSLTLHPRNESL